MKKAPRPQGLPTVQVHDTPVLTWDPSLRDLTPREELTWAAHFFYSS